MPEVLGIISAVVLIVFILVYMDKRKDQLLRKNTIEQLKTYGQIKQIDKHDVLNINGMSYEILFFKVHKNHELTINSQMIWEITRPGGSTLVNQTSFLKSPYKKIIFVYPIETKIKRYINENEMVFVEDKDMFYNMHIVKLQHLKSFFEEVEL